MPALLLLIAALVTNYVRHRQHKSTICSTLRPRIPRPLAAVGLLAFLGWLLPHFLLGYPKRVIDAIDTALADALNPESDDRA